MNIPKRVSTYSLFLLKYRIFMAFFSKKAVVPSGSPEKSIFEFRLETLPKESSQCDQFILKVLDFGVPFILRYECKKKYSFFTSFIAQHVKCSYLRIGATKKFENFRIN